MRRRSLILILTLIIVPGVVFAAESTGSNPQCNPWNAQCPCGAGINPPKCNSGGPNKANCSPGICRDGPTKTPGICIAAGKCKGTSFTDQKGEQQSPGDAKGMMEALKGIMDLLKQAMQGKQGQGQGQGTQPTGQQGCTQYYKVTVPSTDPCAYYVPPVSDSLFGSSTNSSASDALFDALNEGSSLSISSSLLGGSESSTADGTSQGGTGTETTSAGTTSAPNTSGLTGQQVNLQSGTRGDIVVTESGATIYAQARDAGANTEVAGFYGSNAYGGQPQGIISSMCKNRPWAGSIVAFVIPPAFFDSLCAWRGYQVGSPAPPAQPVVEKRATSPSPAPAATSSPQPQAPTITPRVDIWAVPSKVPLGTRTSVFWNTSGVETCSITSPDGSFNETSLSGGAATVPLSGATTFTISCLTAAGVPATDYVTVQLAI